MVSPLARVRGRVGTISIGEHTLIGRFVELAPQGGTISIGDHCSVNDYCVLYGGGGLTIGDNVRIATGVVLITSEHGFADPATPIRLQESKLEPITIGDDVWLGARVTVLAGVSIGSGAVVGAGAVVTRSLPPGAVAYGVPARVVRLRGPETGDQSPAGG